MALADLDQDGDLDLTSADATKNSLTWYENDGSGVFQRHTIQRAAPGWFERHAIGDLDRDGHPDIVVVKNLHGEVHWYRNNGTPTDGRPWAQRVITDALPGAYDVTLADFDGDGDLDVAASSWIKGNRFEWYENRGATTPDRWVTHRIEGHLRETREVCAADLDGDGDADLLATATADNLLLWYENRGNLASDRWQRHVVDDQTLRPVHGEAVDLDGDRDLDILMAFGSFSPAQESPSHTIAWYENRGATFIRHPIARLVNASETVAADLDRDGDMDVIACAWGAETGQVIWLENRGTETPTWVPHKLKSPWSKASGVLTGDLNNDGLPDIVATAERGSNELRCWLQKKR